MAQAITTQVRRVSHITVIVRDMDRALEWYKNALGAEVRNDTPFEWEGNQARWLTVGFPGDDLELTLMPPMPSPNGEIPEPGNGNMTVLEVADCDAVTRHVGQVGGTVVSQPEDMPWGRSSLVRDIDGNPYNLVTPGPMQG